MSITVVLDIDGPRDHLYVLEIAEAVPEAMKVLNHLTNDHASLTHPSEAARLLSYMAASAAGYPQMAEQVTRWLEAEWVAGRIRVTGGEFTGDPGGAVAAVRARLGEARSAAGMLWAALKDAAVITGSLDTPRPRLRAPGEDD